MAFIRFGGFRALLALVLLLAFGVGAGGAFIPEDLLELGGRYAELFTLQAAGYQ